MTDKNSASSGSPSPLRPDDNSSARHLERVVDELRMVLSDLGRTPKHPDPLDEVLTDKKDTPSLPDPDLSEPEAIPFEAVRPKNPNPVSSDADFWNGNVLGWPNNGDNDLAELPVSAPEPESFNDPLGVLNGHDTNPAFANGLGDKVDDLSLKDPVDAIDMSEADALLTSDKSDVPAPNFVADNIDDPAAWTAEEPLISSPMLPDAPLSPLEQSIPSMSKPETAKPEPEPAMAQNPFAPSIDAYVQLAKPSPVSEPEQFNQETSVPIPQTIHKKPEPPQKPVDPNLNLEAPDLKPKGLIQIACIFPEGQEKAGQAFVSKLKELGEKSKKQVSIQAVFVHPWTSDKIDVTAWKKSAVLSGADVMFVLVSKTNAGSLKTLNNDPTSEVKSRIVYLEQIPMRTLYADILVELQRGK